MLLNLFTVCIASSQPSIVTMLILLLLLPFSQGNLKSSQETEKLQICVHENEDDEEPEFMEDDMEIEEV